MDGDSSEKSPKEDLVSTQKLQQFLGRLIQVTLGASDEDAISLNTRSFEPRLARFISDAQVSVLFIQQHRLVTQDDELSTYKYSIVTEIDPNESVISSLALVKRSTYLSDAIALQSQLQIINLPGNDGSANGTPGYEAIHSLVKFAIAPYFDSFSRTQEETDNGTRRNGDTKQGIPVTRKKLAELEISLLHLQQNIDVAHVVLAIHPVVQQAIRAASSAGTRPTINSLIDPTILEDLPTLNAIQATTLTWRQQIKQTTEKDRDAYSGPASQEINFWLNLEQVLTDIEVQLKSEPVSLTFEILAAGKRQGINSAMIMQDTGLKDARDRVKSYNMLMRDFPLNELLSAPSLEKAAEAVEQIFDHVSRRLRTVPYPVARAIPLVEAITREIENQVYSLLRGKRLMYIDFSKSEELLQNADKVFAAYDSRVRDFVTTARDVLRKRNEKFLVIKVNAAHARLQERLIYLRQFRQGHEKLYTTIAAILGTTAGASDIDPTYDGGDLDISAISEISDAYNALKVVDVLDLSQEGTESWISAEQEYDDRITSVETTIIALLRTRLDAATSANEMFRVFSTFNSLFVRPKIRGAVQEYQSQLIDGVKGDIARLQDKFKQQYDRSDACLMNTLRDVPMVSGHIIWARQINRQLDSYMEKVETVLGDGWHLYAEGQKLHAGSSLFRKKLDVKPVYEQWFEETKTRGNIVKGHVFSAHRRRTDGQKLDLVVNFDSKAINLFKEVRNLLHLGFNIPHQINAMAKLAKQVYPHAMLIIECNNTMRRVGEKCQSLGDINMLLASFHNEVQKTLSQLTDLEWDLFKDESSRSRRAAQTVAEWSNAVSVLQVKVDILTQANILVADAISSFKRCAYNTENFTKKLEDLQLLIDKLNLEGFINLSYWIYTLNEQLQQIFVERAREAILLWTEAFENNIGNVSTSLVGDADHRTAPTILHLTHELVLKNQVIYLDPPIESAKASWHSQLSDRVAIVCRLPKLQASRYDLSMKKAIDSKRLQFSNIAELVAAPHMIDAFNTIWKQLDEISSYVSRWLRFQALWDLQLEQVWAILGDELPIWLQILAEIRQARATFDTSEASKHFNHISIHFEQVQARVNAKYDSWQREILTKFASHVLTRMVKFYADISDARKDLELQSLDSSTTSGAVSFITSVQKCKRLIQPWTLELGQFKQGHIALSRQRYHFGSDWLSIDQISAEWGALLEIFERKDKIAMDQADTLRAKILGEDSKLTSKIETFLSDWSIQKPVDGRTDPQEAMTVLKAFGERMNRLTLELESVGQAKAALELPTHSNKDMQPVYEELQDFTSVWSAVSGIWAAMTDLRDTPWAVVVPRKVRSALDAMGNMVKEMPTRMRQYAAFEYIQNVIKENLRCIPLLSDLRSEAVRERHWIKLLKSLRQNERAYVSELTLGAVLDLQLLRNEKVFKDVIIEAQGELALEQFLREVKDYWTDYVLDLVTYQNKCRLIRGWDDLFAKCSENLNSLTTMSHSPYFKIFEDEAVSWEDKLTRVHVLFDVWIDVQRQWLYLEGIFSGNADIKHLLPIESSRFASINSEFFSIMKRVTKSPNILDVIAISGIQKSVERLADMLQKIQKALGEYLERERAQFPRFYFLGDEDLLEIIGNSKDTKACQKHLRKMFSGIAGLLLSEDETTIVGITSKEGEQVLLLHEISLLEHPKINQWLAALDTEMRSSLSELLAKALQGYTELFSTTDITDIGVLRWMDAFPTQILILATQCYWTGKVELALSQQGDALPELKSRLDGLLRELAFVVLKDLKSLKRSRCESLITTFVHQRDVLSTLIKDNVQDVTDFRWLSYMRFYYSLEAEISSKVNIRMADGLFSYGFEYLGVPDRLIQTPLTDRCYLTLTQALTQQLGGSPFGPAGTGKTESVKALGLQLGRFVLVFNCDDSFDYQAMGRILLGLCQVGAWGCFDEFNRLEERILSAVSQQVQAIQLGLRASHHHHAAEVELVGRHFPINSQCGLFITMNPGYAGRSNLPDNLKKLFRSVGMTTPDKDIIAEVTFYGQGFNHAKFLASQVVPFFDACQKRLSAQSHYDFGLRALKSVLLTCGNLKRTKMKSLKDAVPNNQAWESAIVLQSLREVIMPKLVGTDSDQLVTLTKEFFPDVTYQPSTSDELTAAIRRVIVSEGLSETDGWMTKILQLHKILNIHHGVMLVGSAASGKTETWRVLAHALQILDAMETVSYVIDAKVMSKEILYGKLDSTTREWTDGLFTNILRKIVDNLRGEDTRRHWIVFDGDVDPEWVENMNSMLDDNKLLTLPNGERLNLPHNVRIIFEVDTLKHATLATVSRCGMVHFDAGHVSCSLLLDKYCNTSSKTGIQITDEDSNSKVAIANELGESHVKVLRPFFTNMGLVQEALVQAESLTHIMPFSESRALATLFAMTSKSIKDVVEYNTHHEDFPLSSIQLERFLQRTLLINIIWSFSGDCDHEEQSRYGKHIAEMFSIEFPSSNVDTSPVDFDVLLPDAVWQSWEARVPAVEIEPNAVAATDLVIPTTDTIRQETVLYSWLSEHRPLILCGPPGSGKTMTLFSALRKLPHMEVVGLNFSSASTPQLVIKTLEQYCEYRKTVNGTTMEPTQIGKWLVLFCDEINLPSPDKYGTQRVIAFLRQLVEKKGFWRSTDKVWISLCRVQFVGACNPSTDVGRTPLPQRFLRHAPVMMVGYPGASSLTQIYGTFVRASLKFVPNLRGYAEALTSAMVDLYLRSRSKFTADVYSHYIYSPRELTRWIRGIWKAIKPLDALSVEGLVRIWAHEAQRLFSDRLVTVKERDWTSMSIDEVALKHFPNIDQVEALQRPILFSNWLSRNYVPVSREALRQYIRARLKTFCEEEVDTPIVLYDEAIDHILKIDRVFRQPQGHLILIGISGSGKTTLSRFVAWMNGLKTFQLKIHRKYSAQDFDEDLRNVLRRCGTQAESICFILDEANVLDAGFLERMNTLLANAEIPGLFEGDDLATLMTACKEGAQRDGLMLDSKEELYQWFTQQVVRNLHIVFTMNPPDDLSTRAATSPALFNRCVLNWFGDWSSAAFYQVAGELMLSIDLERQDYIAPEDAFSFGAMENLVPRTYRDVISGTLVSFHYITETIVSNLRQSGRYSTYLTPRHFLDMVQHCSRIYAEKRSDLEEQQRHLNMGLDKLHDTVKQVDQLRSSLAEKKSELSLKDLQANQKLQNMISDQQEAEQKKSASLEIQEAIALQEQEIARRRTEVMADLAQAEPAVIEAQKSVSNIKKQQLTEVRSMSNPPEAVKLAMESVCTLLGHSVEGWKSVQSVIRRDDFISSIVHFDNETQMTPQLRAVMQKEYMTKPMYQYEAVNRASKACGPLVQWVVAQVSFSAILDKVGPLRAEVDDLEKEAVLAKRKAMAMAEMVQELEDSIAQYKVEYAELISQTQLIKAEMLKVESKVERSLKLLDSLTSEKDRWQASSQSFESQLETLIGDVILSAAFMAYSGFLDQNSRESAMHKWIEQLGQSGIRYKIDLPTVSYLSSTEDQIAWEASGLPSDDLSVENAIILKRHNRYPLIIDPSGRIVDFLINENKARKLSITSFLDDSFVKHLETALRFGSPILITDAEHLDPIINKILNKEYQKTGGRTLIGLGKQDIDISPSFKLYLLTRDPTVTFPPDICSRVSFVNFTITRGSLELHCLNAALSSMRPDIEEKRSILLKNQGAFQARLQKLEKNLLQALSNSQGNMLDDDVVIMTLESLKREAAEISTKVLESEGVAHELDKVTKDFASIGKACGSIYLVLEKLSSLNRFYQFSLDYFDNMFEYVLRHFKERSLHSSAQTSTADAIVRYLYSTAFRRASQAMLQKDRLVIAVLLSTVYSSGLIDDISMSAFLDPTVAGHNMMTSDLQAIDSSLEMATRLPGLSNLRELTQEHNDQWKQFLTCTEPETIANHFVQISDGNCQSLQTLLLIKTFRADRLIPAMEAFVSQVFSDPAMAHLEYDLKSIVIDEVPATMPVILSSAPGYDAAFKVDGLVEQLQASCSSVAMGSSEGLVLAERAITAAAQNGSWVLLKNIHLAPTWLGQLEKKVQALKPNNNFRLFLTLETSMTVPANLIRMSRALMFEAPPGMRANVTESLSSIPLQLTTQPPVERSRLYFILAWLHSVIQERLRYTGIGWTKNYEFNDSDFDSARRVIDSWLHIAAPDRSNIAPERIPWRAIGTLLSKSTYGGKIDVAEDQVVLDSLIAKFFTRRVFELDYLLVETEFEKLGIPDANNLQQFKQWVNRLPEREPPVWLGLRRDAQQLMLTNEGQRSISAIHSLLASLDSD